jgi:hypothetical protein
MECYPPQRNAKCRLCVGCKAVLIEIFLRIKNLVFPEEAASIVQDIAAEQMVIILVAIAGIGSFTVRVISADGPTGIAQCIS